MSYSDTLISAALDCPAKTGQIPPLRMAKPTRAALEYELLTQSPYTYDHLSFTYEIHCRHRQAMGGTPLLQDQFHSKGQPCMRTSALCKRYGWGAHYDTDGRIAIYPVESDKYLSLLADNNVKKLPGMRNKKA